MKINEKRIVICVVKLPTMTNENKIKRKRQKQKKNGIVANVYLGWMGGVERLKNREVLSFYTYILL